MITEKVKLGHTVKIFLPNQKEYHNSFNKKKVKIGYLCFLGTKNNYAKLQLPIF